MTDQTRQELRIGIEAVVRAAQSGWRVGTVKTVADIDGDPESVTTFDLVASRSRPGPWQSPPLTPAQHLALSVLLGDPATLPQALADYLLDAGHEYATACYERGKRDGNPLLEVMEGYAEAVRQVAASFAVPPHLIEDPSP